MKHFGRKPGSLSLVRSPTEPVAKSCSEDRAAVLKESFDGWINAVAPTLFQSNSIQDEPNKASPNRRSLTFTDILRVNRATIRESMAHRLWPTEVVIRFLDAEVIKRNN